MYQFSKELKIFAIALMAMGVLGTAISFYNAPKTLEDAKAIMAAQAASHHDSHGGGHGDAHAVNHEKTKAHAETEGNHVEAIDNHTADMADKTELETVAKIDSVGKANGVKHDKEEVIDTHTSDMADKAELDAVAKVDTHNTNKETHAKNTHDEHHGDHHAEHVFHQMQNRPVAAFYIPMLFFLGISLLVLAFYAAQRIAHAGWSVVLFRVFEAITNNIHYISVLMLLFIAGTVMHKFHLFPWMKEGIFDPTHANYDAIVDAKKWWMNIPGWTIRGVIYLLGWNVFRYILRKKSIQQDNGDLKLHKNLYNISVGFIVFFMVTESMSVWDWIMGIDPHWFSTLFGWYVLATFLVCALTLVAMVTIYLRSKGYLPLVNDSHIHDLAKFMFGFSVFWTYLWFAQFMLIWYADMPEETVYYLQRFNEYKLPFLGMIVLNFVFPVLLLINSDFKSIPWFVILGGLAILVGHYIDLFVMIMPGTVGGQWGFGIGEYSGLLFFIGLFIYATFSAFAKANPVAKGNPFLHESETHHYYVIEHRGEDSNAHH